MTLVLVSATACGVAGGRSVTLPPPSASPQRVVAAYVAAINAHDISTARTLLTPAWAQHVSGEVDSWFTNVRSITHLHVNRPFVDRLDARTNHYRFGVGVGVTFVLSQDKVYSMPNGATTWGFFLFRNSRHHRWLIGEEGTG